MDNAAWVEVWAKGEEVREGGEEVGEGEGESEKETKRVRKGE